MTKETIKQPEGFLGLAKSDGGEDLNVVGYSGNVKLASVSDAADALRLVAKYVREHGDISGSTGVTVKHSAKKGIVEEVTRTVTTHELGGLVIQDEHTITKTTPTNGSKEKPVQIVEDSTQLIAGGALALGEGKSSYFVLKRDPALRR